MSFQDEQRAVYEKALAHIKAKVTTATVIPVSEVKHNREHFHGKIVGLSFGLVPHVSREPEVRVHLANGEIDTLAGVDCANGDNRFIIFLADKLR